MSVELDDIKRKISALAQKTVENGCTEHETMAAMAMVGRLLQSYNLTMDECDVRKSLCVTIHIPVDGAKRGPIDTCVNPLTALFNGVCWFARDWTEQGRQTKYAFFIQSQDAEALRYLFAVIDSAIENGAKQYKRSADYAMLDKVDKRKATSSFQRGLAHRVAERLREMRRENDAAVKAARDAGVAAGKATGTDLIVLKGKLIREEFAKEGVKLRTATSRGQRIGNHDAYYSGRAAGDNVNLNRPLGNGASGNAGLIA